jgi:hypothetical protein
MRTHWIIGSVVLALIAGACSLAAADEAPSVEVHGWSLTRYYVNTTVDATRDSFGVVTNEEEDSHLEWERFSVSGRASLADGKQVYGEVYIHPWLPNNHASFLYLESFYVDIPVGEGAKVRLGKGRSNAFGIVPGYGNRKTTNYSPLAESFTMDRALGVQYLQQRGNDSFALGVFNSQRPGVRLIGHAADSQMDRGSVPTTTVMHLTDRDSPAGRSGELEVSTRYGRQMGALNVGVSGRIGGLDGQDAAFLAARFPTYNGTNRTRAKYGLDATYKAMPFYATAEYYGGTIGGIRQSGYAVLVGVEPTAQCTGIWRDMSGACKGLFVRYVDLNMGVPTDVTNSMTWDIEQWSVSYVLPLRCKRLPLVKWLQFEYERNTEDLPGGADDVPNDMFFVELFSAF